MSGFFERLAARHASEPEIRPRAASRFEGGVAPAPEAPDVEAPTTPIAISRKTAGLPAPEAPTTPRPTPVGVEHSRSLTQREREPELTSVLAPLERHEHATTSIAAEADARAADAPPERSESITPRIRAVAMPAVAPRERSAPPTPMARVEREPDVVQVHIGRVEVRAVFPTPERPPTRRESAPRPLSLDRYLARERQA